MDKHNIYLHVRNLTEIKQRCLVESDVGGGEFSTDCDVVVAVVRGRGHSCCRAATETQPLYRATPAVGTMDHVN